MDQAAGADRDVLRRIRGGDEEAFRELVGRYQPSLLRLARCYVKTHAAAEEVAQEAWLGLLQGLDRFEGRAALTTWLFRILTNIAKDRAKRDGRSTPLSSLAESELAEKNHAVGPEMFQGPGGAEPGHWSSVIPGIWTKDPEQELLTKETVALAQNAIDALPEAQRAVLLLRDVQGCTAREVCNILEVTETNQRVLLHRARSKVRRTVDEHFADRQEDGPFRTR